MPVQGNKNEEMDDSSEKNERDGYEPEKVIGVFLFCPRILFVPYAAFPQGDQVRHIVVQNALAVSQTFDGACGRVVGEERAIGTPHEYLFALLCSS